MEETLASLKIGKIDLITRKKKFIKESQNLFFFLNQRKMDLN